MSYDDCKTSWAVNWEKTKKPWGEEMVWMSCSGGHGKILRIKKNNRTSFKFNTLKSETLTLISGKVLATHGSENYFNKDVRQELTNTIMTPGVSLNIQSGSPYRLRAIEDSEIIEVGNNCRNEIVRIEDDYGRADDFKE